MGQAKPQPEKPAEPYTHKKYNVHGEPVDDEGNVLGQETQEESEDES